jgi:ATP-dependent exoDNAse (exonuclease V) beta subunit
LQSASTFQVYNASAGSGKTFTLVKEYLKILLTNEDIFTFQRVLAITFTNKAAAEMKDRVLKSLQSFSEGDESPLRQIILEETSLDAVTLKSRSEKLLQAILQNYSAFYITTIDSFTYKIVKSFAYDLGLSQNFEVEMDAQELLNEAVDVLISRIGSDPQLTDVLIEYSLEKTEEDKSWDIAYDLTEFSKILLNEDDARYFKRLSDKSIADFLALKNKTKKVAESVENEFKLIGAKALHLIASHNLEYKDFAFSGECPKHFEKLTQLKHLKPDDLKFEGRLNGYFEQEKSLHASRASEEIKMTIEGIYEALKEFYYESKALYQKRFKEYLLSKILLKSIIPLTVLNNINQQLNEIKEENNIRLNIEFNQLISEHIQEQPAPFIYERIGQKFMHYFIDEMQDTSVLQWTNLIPLIENSLSQENTSLLLVGDGKQAIYRWRGGKAEQFIGLGSEAEESENPFFIPKTVKELETNFRSYSEIVQFNNSFFQHVSGFVQNASYKELFADRSHQKENENKGGFVSLSFLEKEEEKEDELLKYAKKVHSILQHLDEGFNRSDVCVLVRKKKEGVAIANYLSEQGIEIVSSETLLLSNSRKVHFLIDFLKYSLFSYDKESHFEILTFLHDFLELDQDKHQFLANHIHLKIQEFFEALQSFGINFNLIEFHQMPLYEKVEQIIRSFHILKEPDAYVQFFLDEVLAQQKKEASVQDLLDFWELKKDKLSVVSSENPNAVQIMTIHKSKGLEFPVVIFPCDLDIYRELKPKAWITVDEDFPELMVNLNKDIQKISEEGAKLYQQRQEELELDNFNLLYVALTRASEQLYIITDKNLNKTGVENTRFYSGIFISYLKENGLWKEDQNEYLFGNSSKQSPKTEPQIEPEQQTHFISTPWKDHNINLLASSSKLWGTVRGKAINYGDLIHEIMAQIKSVSDIEMVLELYKNKGELDHKNEEKITAFIYEIVQHPQLQAYYSRDFEIYNEREIVGINGLSVIPDRLVIDTEKNTVIIDYKTGLATEGHRDQLTQYASVLHEIGYVVDKKILVYINETITVEEF